MIKINNNYYAKDSIKGITEIERIEEECVFYFRFNVFINIGDGVIHEIITVNDDSANSLGKINYIHNYLLRNFEIC